MSIDRKEGLAMRLFIGLKPSRVDLSKLDLPAKAHHPEDLHLTLAFLGEMDSSKVDALIEGLEQLDSLPLCRWQSHYLGDFPSRQQAKVLACYGDDLSPSLSRILTALEGFPLVAGAIRRPFRPHVTLAPIKKATGIQRPFLHDWQFSELCLYQSVAGKPKYRVLARWSLL